MDENQIKSDFCIDIKFDKDSEEPSRVFKTISDLIETFQILDKDLIVSIDSKIEPVLMLEDIEAGSVKVWLANKIREFDDSILKSGDYKKLIGHYLVKAKYLIIRWCADRPKITQKNEIKQLTKGLFDLAQETDVKALPDYTHIPTTKLLKGIENITNSISHLSDKDKATYIAGDDIAGFNMGFTFVPEEIEELITKEEGRGETTIILKVKKPDYLGESMWEFKHGSSPIYAKILDVEWLKKFQERSVDVRPGDSIKARMEMITKYDYDNNPISTKNNIIKILGVLPFDNPDQEELPLS